MGLFAGRKCLSEPESRVLRVQSPHVLQLSEGDSNTKLGVHLVKLGTFHHPSYGTFDITQQTFDDMLRNYAAGTYGQKIFVDVAHKPDDGAAAEITRLYQDGKWLKGDIVLTTFGRQSITERQYIYLSVDYTDNWKHTESGTDVGAVLFGAGLTIRPFIKGQPGIALAEPTLSGTEANMKHRNQFIKYLADIKCSDALVKALTEQYDAQAKVLTDDAAKEALLKQLSAIATEAVKMLAEKPDAQVIQLQMPAPSAGAAGMTAADVEKLLNDRETSRQLAAADVAKKLSDNKAAFSKLLADAAGLSDDTRKLLATAGELITGDMTADQITRLAEHQITVGNQMEVSKQLSGMGFTVYGSPHITVDETNNIKTLSETVKKALKETNAYGDRRLSLADEPTNLRFVNRVLSEFDRVYAYALQQEHRILSGSPTNMNSAFLPASFQREVIREALADLNILQLVRTNIDPSATTTTQIPYEVLTSASSIPNGGMVTEGNEIPFAGAGIKNETAYVRAMKLALKVTNEIMHFTQSSGVNWNAWGENIASNARIMRELIHLRIANEIQRSSDTYMAVAVSNEAFTASANGLIKTALFPIVRPHQDYDLQGNAINLPECPLTITISGTAIKFYTGDPQLTAGTYWKFSNINLGYIQLVNQLGAVAGAAATGTISYYNPTNLIKFDLNPATGVDYRKNLNNLLSAVGDQKAMLSSQRYSRPEYALMSSMLNNEASKAEQFVMEFKRQGTNDTISGDLESIKGLPSFDCNAPGMDLGDQRILLGQRGLTGYTIIKPYSVGVPFEAVGVNGRPTGEKVAYGEEYNALYTPKAVRQRYTSVLVYNSTTR
jgi:hypothetical protein